MLGIKKERTIAIPWRQGDPLEFDKYFGQEALKRRIAIRMNAMKRGDQLKALFYAPQGSGKTSLGRTIAYELFKRKLADNYKEEIGSNFTIKADVDDLIRNLKPYTVVFIDEIHTISGGAREALYIAIQDNLYIYQRQNKSYMLPEGISWIGATTELGQVHPSLQRRMLPMMLEPLTQKDLVNIASTQPMDIELKAAVLIGKVCYSPWEVKDELYATARDIAINKKQSIIYEDNVKEACQVLGIDNLGLRPQEKRILDVLYNSPKILRGEKAYVMSKTPLVIMAGVDTDSYSAQIEPKLLKLGLLQIATTGRELTRKALEVYYE